MENINQNTAPPPEMPEKHWYSRKSFVAIVLLTLVAGTAVATYFILNQPQNLGPVVASHATIARLKSPAAPTGPSTSYVSLLNTEGWKEYKNDDWGLGFKYPPDWAILEAENPYSYTVQVRGPNVIAQLEFTTFGAGGLANLQKVFPGQPPKVDNVVIGYKDGIRYAYPPSMGGIQIISQLPKWQHDGNFINYFTNGIPTERADRQKYLDAIISTVRFYEPNVPVKSSDWRRYRSDTSGKNIGFSLQYPPDWSSSTIGFPTLTERSGVTISLNTPALNPGGFGKGVSKSIIVDGLSATEVVGDNSPIGGTGFAVVSFDDPTIKDKFDLNMTFDPANKKYYVKLLEDILYTFAFDRINLDTNYWNVEMNNDMGVEILYPVTWNVTKENASSIVVSSLSRQQDLGASYATVEKDGNCQPTGSFQQSSTRTDSLERIMCFAGYKFTLDVWKDSYDKNNIMQALAEIPQTLSFIDPDSINGGMY